MLKAIGIIILIAAAAFVLVLTLQNSPAPLIPTNFTSEVATSTNTNSQLKPQKGLPDAVIAKREAIYVAAKAHDYEALAALMKEGEFKYSFGGNYSGGFIAFLKDQEKKSVKDLLDLMTKLLEMPHDKQLDIYVWPGFFTKAAEDWNAEDIALMRTFMTDTEIEGNRQFGAYIGYRLGIKEDGTWVYYLAGD